MQALTKGNVPSKFVSAQRVSNHELPSLFVVPVKNIREDEKLAWHPDADIYWQKNAWTDAEFSIKWAEQTLAKSVTDLKRYVFFLDNLTAQETEAFKKTVADLKGIL